MLPTVTRLCLAVIFVVATAAASGCATSPGTTSPGSSTSPTPSQPAVLVWPAPADASAAVARAGLPMLGEEKLEVHYHAHLDVIIRGTAVPVPASIGIDTKRHRISPLHTHDANGIVHIESAVDVPFTVGQLFTEWDQPLSQQRVGTVTAAPGEQVRLYRNGVRMSGDPAAVRFVDHDEIVVWLGSADEQPQVPTSYPFPAGL